MSLYLFLGKPLRFRSNFPNYTCALQVCFISFNIASINCLNSVRDLVFNISGDTTSRFPLCNKKWQRITRQTANRIN